MEYDGSAQKKVVPAGKIFYFDEKIIPFASSDDDLYFHTYFIDISRYLQSLFCITLLTKLGHSA